MVVFSYYVLWWYAALDNENIKISGNTWEVGKAWLILKIKKLMLDDTKFFAWDHSAPWWDKED